MPIEGPRELVAQQLRANGRPYLWGGIDPFKKGADCSGFDWWGLEQLGRHKHKKYRTAQALFNWCKANDLLIPVEQGMHTLGAWGFMGTTNNIHHIVTSLGNGSTIQAANRRDGIGVFKWKGINFAGLCPELDWMVAPAPTAQHPAAPPPQKLPSRPTLILNNTFTRANQVAIGELLFVTGWTDPGLKASYAAGRFDKPVLDGVSAFQRFMHKPVTGQFDTLTWEAIDFLVLVKGHQPALI